MIRYVLSLVSIKLHLPTVDPATLMHLSDACQAVRPEHGCRHEMTFTCTWVHVHKSTMNPLSLGESCPIAVQTFGSPPEEFCANMIGIDPIPSQMARLCTDAKTRCPKSLKEHVVRDHAAILGPRLHARHGDKSLDVIWLCLLRVCR